MKNLSKAERYLLEENCITEEYLEKTKSSLREGAEVQEILRYLFRNLYINEAKYYSALALEFNLQYKSLDPDSLSSSLSSLIPKNIARKYRIIPLSDSDEQMEVAVDDPQNYTGTEEVKKIAHKPVIVYLINPASLNWALNFIYGKEDTQNAIENMERTYLDDEEEEQIEDIGAGNRGAAAPEQLVNTLLMSAVRAGASDIHFEPHTDELMVRFRVDGMLRDESQIPKWMMRTVMARIKVMGNMDVSERRKPQDGRYSFTYNNRMYDLRISSLPTIFGEKVVIRILDKTEGTLDKNAIGLTGEDKEKYDQLIRNHNGVVLIVGPTGSGKSSTMYTMVKILNQKDVNIITLEDPVEYNVDGVSQVQIDDKVGMTFANGLRAALRQDPDIICVGEIRDGETADIAMRAAITGHLVISTVHTNDAISTFERLADIGVEPYLTSSAMLGIISQRLVRKICPKCKDTYTPTTHEINLMGGEEAVKGIKFYKGSGCPYCSDTGYYGRTGVFEILIMNQELRRALVAGEPRSELLRIASENGFVSLRENCMELIRNGVTTPSEMARIINAID